MANKVGQFIANEMLGVDDIKRAVNKAKKGDVKGALKSAGAAAFEIGTTATAVGKGGALATKVAAKSISKKAVEDTSTKVGQNVGKRIAETTKPSKYPSAEGKNFSIKTEGKATTTSKSGSKTTVVDSKKVEGTKKAPTENQRLGSYQGQEKKRVDKITAGASTSKEVSKTPIKEALGDERAKTAARGVIAGKAIVKLTQSSQPTASKNPIRSAGDSTTKRHPDNQNNAGKRK
jgi:hypothetical protein